MHTHHRPHRPGFALTDALALIGVVVLSLCLVSPLLAQLEDEKREAACANNLRQLSAASLAYAADHNGYYLYDWPRILGPSDQYEPDGYGNWFDAVRIGQYLPDSTPRLADNSPNASKRLQEIGQAVLGPMVCPGDSVDEVIYRNYSQNFWATGAQSRWDPLRPGRNSSLGESLQDGDFFDSKSDKLDRLMLFAESYALSRFRDGWVAYGMFGGNGSVSQRLNGNGRPPRHMISVVGPLRFGKFIPAWLIDYSRHGELREPLKPEGFANIAFADGHVSGASHDKIYNPQSWESREYFLWSPAEFPPEGP